ncbi:hypothetical protein MSAN_02426400 [Mycena sanguinolenta]|uniref:Uncharacterized protein n=1 Tax=Mycena sanguinolenta TaxID=230812 RepID=A0A8H6X2J8_9AGAR|nr:hypothetical protein MSAN_02426400 [Mycena sanguinolenta]
MVKAATGDPLDSETAGILRGVAPFNFSQTGGMKRFLSAEVPTAEEFCKLRVHEVGGSQQGDARRGTPGIQASLASKFPFPACGLTILVFYILFYCYFSYILYADSNALPTTTLSS